MTLVLDTPDDRPVAIPGLRHLASFVRTLAARRAQRIALGQLMLMDAHRLDDLGISHDDVVTALRRRGRTD